MLARALALGVLEAGARFEARTTVFFPGSPPTIERRAYRARLGPDARLHDDMLSYELAWAAENEQPASFTSSSLRAMSSDEDVAAASDDEDEAAANDDGAGDAEDDADDSSRACIQCTSVDTWIAFLVRAYQLPSADDVRVSVRARLLDGRVQETTWSELVRYLAEQTRGAARVPLPYTGMDGEALSALECARTEPPVHSAEELAAAGYLCADATARRAVLWTTSAGRKYKRRATEMAQHVVHMRRALRALTGTVCALAATDAEDAATGELRAAARVFAREYEARASAIVAEDTTSARASGASTGRKRAAHARAADGAPSAKAPTLAAAVVTEFT